MGQVDLSLMAAHFGAILLSRHNTSEHVLQDGLSLKGSQSLSVGYRKHK